MKHLKLFFALFAMLALGVGNAWGAESLQVTLDFTTNSWGFPNGSGNKTVAEKTYTSGDYSIILAGGGNSNGHYFNSNGYLMLGKSGATLTLPAFDFNTTKIVVTGKSGASESVGQNIFVGNTAVSTATTGATGTNTYTINADYQAAGNVYVLKVTTGHNTQITKIEIYGEASGGGETPGEGGGGEDPDSGEETSATMTAGTNGTACTVNGKDGIKVGTSKKGGDMQITVPAGATMLHVYAAAWNGVTGLSLNITPTSNVTTTSITLTADAGIANNTPFTLSGNEADYLFDIPLQNITAETTLTFTSSTTKRFVVWGATYETAGADEPGTGETVPSVTLDPSSKDFGTVNVGENPSQEFTITTENTTATLTASIDDNINYAVSAIDGNKVTVTYQPQSAATHPAVLTVKAGEEATATVNLTGKAVQALEGTWILVTDASSLNVGDKIIIAAKESDVALSTTQADNNRPEVAITKNDNTITATSETQVLTLQAGNKENTLALYTGDGYLYAASSGSNWLRTETTLSDNSSWSIAVAADGTATLIAQGTNTRNTLYYNKNSKIFSCYSNAQQPIALYKNTNGKQLAGLAYATTKYLTKLGDTFTTPTLTNPNSLTVTYSSSDNNVATVDDKGTVTIKAAGVVVITAAFAGDASYLEGSAKYTLCVTEHAGTEADPYSVADARRVIDVMETAEGVYATGIVSEIVTAYNSEYGNITYNISIDGSTAADQLQAYRGKGVNGENFSSANDIKVGDEVVIKGNLKLHNGTLYEFDANNQLVSLKREKQQAGLAYATTEYSTTLGESFETPTLTNPNGLTVTYSSDNTSAVEVNEETGEVTIKAVGKAKITATFAGNLTYAPGSASYTITVTGVATLPFAFDGKQADIENTPGMSHDGIDATDYKESPYLKMNTTGDWLVIRFDSEPEKLSYDIENNSFNGGTFSVLESADGETYTDVAVYTTIEETQNEEYTLLSTSRYVKFIYTEKLDGNVGLGNIKITKPDLRQEAGIAWSAESTTITIGDAFTAPTLSNPKGLTLSCTSDNEDLATVTNAGVVTLKEGVTGKAVITATFAGNETYKPAEVTTTIIVSPKTGEVVILAKHKGKWYAMKAEYVSGKTDRLIAIPVYYVNGKLYNVSEEDKAAITWTRSAYGDNTVSFQNKGNYLKGKSSTTLILEANEDGLYQWNAADNTMLIGETTRTFLYHKDGIFRNYSITLAGETSPSYSNLPVVTAPEFATGNVYTINTSATNGTTKGAGTYVEGSTVTLIADPAMDYTFVNWTVDGEVVSTANPYEFEAKKNLDLVAHFATIEQTEKKLTGTFSVGKYEVAQFATGNLQYQPSKNIWSFAKQQYQYIGEDNINVGDENYKGWIDMFGWSNGEDNDFGANPSSNKNDYDGEFVDWGKLFPVEDNWATLTKDQWDYLLNQRGAGKKQIARVGTVFGVLLFPDEWTMPSGISVTAQYDSYFKVNVYNYTLAQWTELENAGALFMPAAGRRFGGHGNTYRADGITNIGEEYKLQYCTNDLAAYWTSTKNDDGTKVNYLLNLGDKGTKYSTLELGWVEYGHAGQSVRLAKVTDVYTRTTTAGKFGTICLEFGSTNYTGMELFECVGQETGKVYIASVTTLEAGVPYIFLATGTELAVYSDGTTAATPGDHNGLHGTFTNDTEVAVGNYILKDNALCQAATTCYVNANRAYLVMSEVPEGAPVQMPGRRYIGMSVQGENEATGFENITNGENITIKTIENGQLIIIRDGEMYNAQGQRL